MTDLVDRLSHTSFFGDAAPAQLEAVAAAGTERDLVRGDVLFYEGDPPDALYLVTKGRIAIAMSSPIDKRESVVALMEPGDLFGDMGFDIVSGPLFQTPEETVVLALESDVDVVGASSLAAGHKTLIPELIHKLREAGRTDIKVIAGGVIPPQDYDYLRDAGVQGIYGPGSNVVECAADVLRLLGHNMPPAADAPLD